MRTGHQDLSKDPSKEALIAAQAVPIYPGVKAIAQQNIRVDNRITIPKGALILVQPLDADTANLQSPLLNYRISLIKALSADDSDLPESQRNIEVTEVYEVQLQNYDYNLPIIRKMPLQLRKTTSEDVRVYLTEKKHELGIAAFVHSGGKRLFYVDQEGKITELPSDRINFPQINLDRELSLKEARIFYSAFPELSYFIFTEKYGVLKEDTPVFPADGSPSINEIRQMLIPDCFLLASLQTILNYKDGRKFIRGMFTDHYDGLVSVRLFDPETRAPVFIKIRKAILLENSNPLNGHTALWVHLIEKAYASIGQKEDKQVGPSPAAVFSGGGHPHFALQILTGIEGKYKPIQLKKRNTQPSFMKKKCFKDMETVCSEMRSAYREAGLEENEIAQAIQNQMENQIRMSFPDVAFADETFKYKNEYISIDMSDETISALKQLIDFYEKNSVAYDTIMDDETTSFSEKADKVLELLKEKEASPILSGLFSSVKEEIESSLLVPFSGHYNQSTMEIYTTISENLNSGNLITASSRSKENFEGTGFEPLPGIACRHAYSVHRAFSRKETINGKAHTVFYVTVRNPWGTMGRSYEKNASGELTGIGFQNNNNPYYDIELNEFAAAMCGFSTSEKWALFYHDELKDDIEKILEGNSLVFSGSLQNEELLKNKQEFSKLMDSFFRMELLHLSSLSIEAKEKIELILKTDKNIYNQRAKILKILNENNQNTPFYTGHSDYKNTHLFNLLKLKEAMDSGDLDSEQIISFKREIIEMSNHPFSQKIIEVQDNFNYFSSHFLAEKLAGFSEQVESLHVLLERTPRDIDSYHMLNQDDHIDQAQAFQQCYYSRVATLNESLKEINASKVILKEFGCVLPENIENLLVRLVEQVNTYNQSRVFQNISRIEKDLSSIKSSIERLKARKTEDESLNAYRERLDITFAAIDNAIQACASLISDLKQVKHPLSNIMEQGLQTVRQEFQEVRKEKASSYEVGVSYPPKPVSPKSSPERDGSSSSSPELLASSPSNKREASNRLGSLYRFLPFRNSLKQSDSSSSPKQSPSQVSHKH